MLINYVNCLNICVLIIPEFPDCAPVVIGTIAAHFSYFSSYFEEWDWEDLNPQNSIAVATEYDF